MITPAPSIIYNKTVGDLRQMIIRIVWVNVEPPPSCELSQKLGSNPTGCGDISRPLSPILSI